MREKKVSGTLQFCHYTHAAGLGKNKAGTSGFEFMCSFFSPIQSNRDIDHKAFVFFRHQEQ
ncbi:hypothetical protein J2Y79_002425 [Bacillus velezensis]|nr:hypothetical protein [Bacillus velezensis]